MKNLGKITAVLLLAAAVGVFALTSFDAYAKALMQLRAELMGPEIEGVMPEGDADWRMLDQDKGNRLKVGVEDVNLPDGTMLTVSGCGSSEIGIIELEDGEGDFDIREERGDAVPTCEVDDEISVMRASSTVLSGVFMDKDEEMNMEEDMENSESGRR